MSYTAKDLNPLVRGDDWTIKLVLKEGNNVLDISGYTYYMTLKSNLDDPDPGAIQVSTTASGADAASGIVYITASSTDTATVEPKTYNYDVQQIDTSNNVQTLLIGKVKVVKDVTRTIA